MATTDPDRALVPGQELRFPRPMVSFLAEGHPQRTTVLGPLIPRNAALNYIGPFPGRPGMHLAATKNDAVPYEVPFQLADLS